MATKEEIYDAEISPLMVRIIATCKEHSIPCVASFQIDDERPATGEDGAFLCTTAILPADACDELKAAAACVRNEPASMMRLRTVDKDGQTLVDEVIIA